ncbi:MAG: class I SAM-dependent methyltransferase [Candidatus Omnitrophica bacterium]|nr:class I SAM-dependent methyltransferase [Candidatus Omnitrophota bacterium]
MIKKIKNVYDGMKKYFLKENAELIPAKYHSQFICLGGASEVQYQIARLIAPDKKKILIIGIFGGRDYYYMKTLGKEVYAFDLFKNNEFDNLQVGNVEKGLPYPDSFFDAVILGEVIEHLVYDYDALLNIRRVLKNDGVLILSIPFLNDSEPTHIRIYNKIIIKRFLSIVGFSVDNILERPNLFYCPKLVNFLHHSINFLLFIFLHKTIYKHTLPLFWKIEYYLSQTKNPLRKYSRLHGAIIKCCKNKKINYVNLNKTAFNNNN